MLTKYSNNLSELNLMILTVNVAAALVVFDDVVAGKDSVDLPTEFGFLGSNFITMLIWC